MLARGTKERERDERAKFLAWSFEKFERFAGLLDIKNKSAKIQKFRLNAIQSAYCISRTDRDIVLKPRQVGFTTLEQARDVFYFLTVPGSHVVTTCQSIQDKGPVTLLSANYELMFDSLRRAGVALDFRVRSGARWSLAGRGGSTLRIIQAGGSERAAAKVGRAGTVQRLHATETAFYEYAEETMNALLECVPVGDHSQIVSESTPNGAAGLFYEQCQAAASKRSSYTEHFFAWFRHPHEYALPLDPGEIIAPENEFERLLVSNGVTREQLKWARAKIQDKGQDKFDQEYPSDPDTCFLVSGRAFFDSKVVTVALKKAETPIEYREKDCVSIFQKPIPGVPYVVAMDASEGAGNDPVGGLVTRRDTGEHVATIFGQLIPWEFARVGYDLGLEYNKALLVPERNNHGHAVIQALVRDARGHYPRIFVAPDEKVGWDTNTATRPKMLDELQDSFRKGLVTSPDRNVLGQMRTFVVSESGKPEAARGSHDDLVLAMAIGFAVRQRGAPADYSVGGVRSARG